MSSSTSHPSTPQPLTTSNPPSHRHHPAHNLLSRAHSAATADAIFTDKIQHKPLFLAPTTTVGENESSTNNRAKRRHIRLRRSAYHVKHQRPKPLSAREKRRLGLHGLRAEEVEGLGEKAWSVYEGLNRLWEGYVGEILGFSRETKEDGDGEGQSGQRLRLVEGWETKEVDVSRVGSVLAGMEMVGAWVRVVRHADVGRVGLKGVVVRDTRYTFVLVVENERKNGRVKVRRVIKKGGVFEVRVCLRVGEEVKRTLKFEVFGSAFQLKPVDRAKRKFKWRQDLVQEYL